MTEESLEVAQSQSPHSHPTVNPFESVTSTNAETTRSTSDRPGDVLEAHGSPSPPPSTQEPPETTRTGAPTATDETLPPEVASLKAIFPDFDPAIIHSVLESVNGNQEHATDVLLGMSDPEYVSQERVQAPQLTQTELDEQLARRLMLEDQQQAQQQQQYYQQQHDTRVPYQPRVQGRTQAWSNQGEQNQGRDTMSEVSDQFSKIAESGKRTFSSFVTKMKAKIQEFDQSRQSGGPSSRQNEQYNQYQPRRTSGQYGDYNQQYHPDYAPNSQAQGTVDYFAANPEPQLPARPAQGYDLTPPPRGSPPIPTVNPTPTLNNNTASSASSNTYPSPAGTPPASIPTPVGIDRTKLGMLPKRPVSLVADTPAPESQRHDDEDELDYVENPFEEEHR